MLVSFTLPILCYLSLVIFSSPPASSFVVSRHRGVASAKSCHISSKFIISSSSSSSSVVLRRAAPTDSDYEAPRAVSDGTVDANIYNVDVKLAADLWTASVQETKSGVRDAGVPYVDTKSKDHFVDDLEGVVVSRVGGLGMDLLELAGGREDGLGITMITAVSSGGNAEKAGILPGDSIASVAVVSTSTDGAGNVEEAARTTVCECMDFDNTIGALTTFPGDEPTELVLGIKRLRRWPKVKVEVSYPPSQCAEGVDNREMIELFAGENLQRALLNRRIIMDDPTAPKCDYCGNKCTVSITRGMNLLNPISITEEKIMARNPKCRLSCKSTVGYNMQEGDLQLRVNLRSWNEN